jgi:RNA polymerase sigma-70 factor, ECF subfamily
MALTKPEMVEMFNDHQPALARYAGRRVGRDAAPDIVAETFSIAFRQKSRPDAPLPWLYAIARNLIRNHVRSAQRSYAAPQASVSPDPADEVGERDLLLRALRSLSDVSQEVLMLSAWEGLDAAEGAVVMNCSVNSFRVRLHRARRQMEEALGEVPILTLSSREEPAT